MAPRTFHAKPVDDGIGAASVDVVEVSVDVGNRNETVCGDNSNVSREDGEDDDRNHPRDDVGGRGFDDGNDENNDEGGHDDDDDDDGDGDVGDEVVEVEDDSAIPVDKGRAWLVMISCFLMHVLVVGGGKSFGVFVQEFQDRFQVGAKELGIINGIALMLMLGLGIFVNMLAVRFSARRVVTAGSLLTSVGFVLTAFVTSFRWLYVTYGVVTGLGFALSFSPTIVMMGQCFKKYRSVALGFAVSGSGFGSFAFPGLARFLINHYGLRGCLLIIGGLMLNVAVCGFLLPPHRSRRKAVKRNCVKLNHSNDCSDSLIRFQDSIPGKDCKDSKLCLQTVVRSEHDIDKKDIKDSLRASLELNPLTQERIIDGKIFVPENIEIEVINDASLENELKIPSPFLDKIPLKLGGGNESKSVSNGHLSTNGNNFAANIDCYGDMKDTLYPTNDLLSKSANFLHVQRPREIQNREKDFLYRKECKSLSTSHLPHFSELQNGIPIQNTRTKISSFNKISTSLAYVSNCDLAMHSQGHLDRRSILTSRSKDLASRDKSIPRRKKTSALFEWSLLTNPPFIMHFFSAYFGYICYITNLFMLVDYSNACGLDRDTAAFTLSVVGILELVARLTFPPITEVLCCRRRTSWGMSLTVMGLLNLAVPHITVLSSIMAYAVVFGYACGCFTTLIPVLCAEIKGPEKMGSSFGLTTIGMGLAVMTGPPLSGTIKDISGRWDHGFVTVGCLALISASLAFLEPFVQTRWKARHQKHNEAIATRYK